MTREMESKLNEIVEKQDAFRRIMTLELLLRQISGALEIALKEVPFKKEFQQAFAEDLSKVECKVADMLFKAWTDFLVKNDNLKDNLIHRFLMKEKA